MPLYAKIFAGALLPFVIFFLAEVIHISRAIEQHEHTLDRNIELKAENVRRNIERMISQLDTAATVLSKSEEISKALQRADNDVLFDISKRFIEPIDSILFADISGIVISRAPEEYRFGDNVGSKAFFRPATTSRSLLGTGMIDGKTSIFVSKPIRKYDDMVVGLVCVNVFLSKEILNGFSGDPSVIVEFDVNGLNMTSDGKGLPVVRSQSMEGIFPDDSPERALIRLHFTEDENVSGLLSVRRSLYTYSIFMVLFSVGLLSLILYRQLKGYSNIVGLIRDYADLKIDASVLKHRLKQMKYRRNQDAAKIVHALVQMLELMESHFNRMEEYNQELNETVEKLETSLKEVKKLSGLLPICSICKKIRDDKGYWNQLEAYIQEHSSAQFSHSICRECAETHYPDLKLYHDPE